MEDGLEAERSWCNKYVPQMFIECARNITGDTAVTKMQTCPQVAYMLRGSRPTINTANEIVCRFTVRATEENKRKGMGLWGSHFKQVGQGRCERQDPIEQRPDKVTVRAMQIIWGESIPGSEKSQCQGPGARGAESWREGAKKMMSERQPGLHP